MMNNKKECELCNSPATMYCESDRASLCWKCDSKIHSANFLVAKHVRSLLCHICRCPTPWKASGAKLGSTLTACRSCVSNKYKQTHQVETEAESAGESQGGNEEESEDEDEDEDEDESEAEVESDTTDEEEIDNQVVPMASIPLQPVSSSSNSEQESSKFPILLKRLRNPHEDDLSCSASSSSSSYSQPSEEEILFRLVRPFKAQKREETVLSAAVNYSGSDLLLNSLRKFHQQILSTPNTSTNLNLGLSI